MSGLYHVTHIFLFLHFGCVFVYLFYYLLLILHNNKQLFINKLRDLYDNYPICLWICVSFIFDSWIFLEIYLQIHVLVLEFGATYGGAQSSYDLMLEPFWMLSVKLYSTRDWTWPFCMHSNLFSRLCNHYNCMKRFSIILSILGDSWHILWEK